ncbi:MAG: response regulator [Hyphomonadaceae bacterium]|nr:response regulator [Hyphomonadaceae bacterium]
MSGLSETIVIVDDDDGVRNSLHTFFEVSGYSVYSFENAEEYLQSELLTPSCLVIDLELHGLNGVAAMEILQEQNRFGPTIVITGTYRNDLMLAAEKSAALAVIAKPVDPQILEAKITEIVMQTEIAM